jgi:UDP-N-acetylglucosamine 1-carboxyvinyltransferase
MDTFVVNGGNKLIGEVVIAGAKNVALKACVCSLLTDDILAIGNIPEIRDVYLMLDVLRSLGVNATFNDHKIVLKNGSVTNRCVPLDVGARLRTSSLVLGPMLARYGEALIPNPGGCRIGARPIDRHIDALKAMGAEISYISEDGYFHAKAAHLHGADITFPKNTHTGTETIILAAVLADGTTTINNAAEEVEVFDLISLLNQMGAKITRPKSRTIVIEGVKNLSGTEFNIMPDRNEEMTFAIAAAITGGSVVTHNSAQKHMENFLRYFMKSGGTATLVGENSMKYEQVGPILPSDVVTGSHPGFMTDWQAPWAVYMTQANGVSTLHETVFESRFSYVSQLIKMGSKIEYFDPSVANPQEFYNFNWEDRVADAHQAIRIVGPTKLHNAVLEMNDLRAGATLLLGALIAEGESYIHGVEQIDRGYEHIEERLVSLGAQITRVKKEVV